MGYGVGWKRTVDKRMLNMRMDHCQEYGFSEKRGELSSDSSGISDLFF